MSRYVRRYTDRERRERQAERAREMNKRRTYEKRTGGLEEPVQPHLLAYLTAKLLENMADDVSRLFLETGMSHRNVSRRVGRDMTRTLHCLLKAGDTTLSTLSDVAAAHGKRLEIKFVDCEIARLGVPRDRVRRPREVQRSVALVAEKNSLNDAA